MIYGTYIFKEIIIARNNLLLFDCQSFRNAVIVVEHSCHMFCVYRKTISYKRVETRFDHCTMIGHTVRLLEQHFKQPSIGSHPKLSCTPGHQAPSKLYRARNLEVAHSSTNPAPCVYYGAQHLASSCSEAWDDDTHRFAVRGAAYLAFAS